MRSVRAGAVSDDGADSETDGGAGSGGDSAAASRAVPGKTNTTVDARITAGKRDIQCVSARMADRARAETAVRPSIHLFEPGGWALGRHFVGRALLALGLDGAVAVGILL